MAEDPFLARERKESIVSSAYREKVLSFPLLFAMFRTRVSNKSGKENFLFLHLPFRPRRRVFSTPLNANSESLSTKVGRGKRKGLNSMCHLLVTSLPPPALLGQDLKRKTRGGGNLHFRDLFFRDGLPSTTRLLAAHFFTLGCTT